MNITEATLIADYRQIQEFAKACPIKHSSIRVALIQAAAARNVAARGNFDRARYLLDLALDALALERAN